MSSTKARARLLREALEPYAATDPASGGAVKLSVSLPRDLVEVLKATAASTGLSVSATIAAALRRTLVAAEQERLDAALSVDRAEDREWAAATSEGHAKLLRDLKW